MRGPWSWRRFPLQVQPLFKFQELFKFLPAWAERSDPGRCTLFRWGLGWAFVFLGGMTSGHMWGVDCWTF